MDNISDSDLSTDNPTEEVSITIAGNEIRIASNSSQANHTEFLEILQKRLECIDN